MKLINALANDIVRVKRWPDLPEYFHIFVYKSDRSLIDVSDFHLTINHHNGSLYGVECDFKVNAGVGLLPWEHHFWYFSLNLQLSLQRVPGWSTLTDLESVSTGVTGSVLCCGFTRLLSVDIYPCALAGLRIFHRPPETDSENIQCIHAATAALITAILSEPALVYSSTSMLPH